MVADNYLSLPPKEKQNRKIMNLFYFVYMPIILFITGIILDIIQMRKSGKTYEPYRSAFRKSFPNYVSPILYLFIAVPIIYSFFVGRSGVGYLGIAKIILVVAWAIFNIEIIRHIIYTCTPRRFK